jgi:hypothetical protein
MLAQAAAGQEVDDATRASARQLGYAGVEAFQAHNYASASEKLERAFRVLQVPSLGLWSARALAKIGKLVEAQERYLRVGRLPVGGGDADVQRKAQVDAAAELELLAPRVPNVLIELQGASPSDVALTIDGVAVASDLVGEPRPVNPGTHTLVATRGDERSEAAVTLAESERKPVVLHFAGGAAKPVASRPAAAPAIGSPTPASATEERAGGPQRTAAWLSIGVGAAGLVVGGVTGVLAIGKGHDLSSNPRCQNNACGPSQQDKVESYNSMRTISTIGFIAGGVATATGVVLLLTTRSGPAAPSAALWLGPTGARVTGAF